MTVKADSKGRLTGAQPETRYTRKEHPDGRIEYTPAGLKPSTTGTTVVVDNTGRPGRIRIMVETEAKDLLSSQGVIHRVAETTGATEVWVKASGLLGGVFDLLGQFERPYKLVGYNPSAKDFEGLE